MYATANLQVSTFWGELPSDYTQPTNPCSGLMGAAVDVGPARDVAAGVGFMEVERPLDNLTGFGGPRRVLRGLSGTELSSGAGLEIFGSAGLSACWRSGGDADPRSTSDFIDLNLTLDNIHGVRTKMKGVNKRVIYPSILKHRKWKIFQTLNQSRIVWDPKAKMKGLLCGHLNIRSIKLKSDQVHHILLNSNLDFLCLSDLASRKCFYCSNSGAWF